MSGDAPTVAAWGFFGMGNIGNEGTLSAFLGLMREVHPNAKLSCFAGDALLTERDHGIPAVQIMTYRADPTRTGLGVKLLKAVSRVWDVPRTWRLMRHVDVLVVAGTGILESKLMPTPWGLPYWLFLAALSCRLQGGRVVLLGVGAEYPIHPVTRWLYGSILRLSHVRSFRDEESRNAMRSVTSACRLAPVVPDLTFAMPTPQGPRVHTGRLAIGVMGYDGAIEDPVRGEVVRRRYLDGMSRTIAHLLDDGCTVTLFIGDVHDLPVAVEIEHLVRHDRPELGLNALTVSRARTLQTIMLEMAEAEVVVASRFHNIVCALKLAKPVVSLGYAAKNANLLRQFGVNEVDQPIDTFDVDRLLMQIAEAQRTQPMLKSRICGTLEAYSGLLDEHFRQLSAELSDARTTEERRMRRGAPA